MFSSEEEYEEWIEVRAHKVDQALATLLHEGVLIPREDGPVVSGMIQGFTALVRVLDEAGDSHLAIIFGPHDHLTQSLGDARYMLKVMDQSVLDHYFEGEED